MSLTFGLRDRHPDTTFSVLAPATSPKGLLAARSVISAEQVLEILQSPGLAPPE